MQATINLTAVLITLIICVTLYALCKMARKEDDKKNTKQLKGWEEAKVLEVPAFMNQRRSNQEQHLVEYVEGQVKKGEAKK